MGSGRPRTHLDNAQRILKIFRENSNHLFCENVRHIKGLLIYMIRLLRYLMKSLHLHLSVELYCRHHPQY